MYFVYHPLLRIPLKIQNLGYGIYSIGIQLYSFRFCSIQIVGWSTNKNFWSLVKVSSLQKCSCTIVDIFFPEIGILFSDSFHSIVQHVTWCRWNKISFWYHNQRNHVSPIPMLDEGATLTLFSPQMWMPLLQKLVFRVGSQHVKSFEILRLNNDERMIRYPKTTNSSFSSL